MSDKAGTFYQAIIAFNKMYELPCNSIPSLDDLEEHAENRLQNFEETISKEIFEVDEILAMFEDGYEESMTKIVLQKWEVDFNSVCHVPMHELYRLVVLTMIADWLGDIIVYAASEMRKFGLDGEKVLSMIMTSNFSKLGADGKPIYNDKGKVEKGPDYFKPEPALLKLIAEKRGITIV